MKTIFLALGSNVGPRQENIDNAIRLLGQSIVNIVRAPTYSTKPVGYLQQDEFLNTAIQGETGLLPQDLLLFIKQVERDVGRIKRFRNGPREIDIDIIFYADEVVEKPNLHIPHIRFSERDFVLKPLSDLVPDFIDPISKQTVSTILKELPASKLSIIGKM